MDQNYMKEKKVLPLVVSMSLPMVVSMAVNSMYNIVDSFFVAKISESAMTALSLVFPVQNLMTAIAVGFGVGMNARIAFCLGAGDQTSADKAASTGLFMSFIHGILLMAVSLAVMPGFLSMYTENEEILKMGLVYADRAFLFSVVIMVSIALEKIFQAVGRMKVSMISMIIGFAVNILLDPLMIFGIGIFPEMGIAGAAYATGIGQTACLVSYLVFLKISPVPLSFGRRYVSFEGGLLTGLYAVGIPATLNMALPSLLISSLNAILTSFSEMYVLVLGAYYKLQTFIYLSANGIIQGIRPLVSFNYGAGDDERVKSIFKTTLLLTAGVMVIGAALSTAVPETLTGLFTSNPETIEAGAGALRIICVGFIPSAVSVTCCGVLEALGRGISSLAVSLLRYALIIIPAAWLLSRFIGANGVFLAFPLTELLAAAASWSIWRRCCSFKHRV